MTESDTIDPLAACMDMMTPQEKKEHEDAIINASSLHANIPPMNNMTSLTSFNYNQMEDNFSKRNQHSFR